MVPKPNTFLVRKAVSVLKLISLLAVFFVLPVYGMGLGIDMPASKIKWVTITNDWYDFKGTQTPPPPFVQPGLYTALGLSIVADLLFIFVRDQAAPLLQVSRTFDFVAGIGTAICGELILEHVESNTSSALLAPQTAKFGPLISVMMLIIFVPIGYESIVIFDQKTPNGD